MDFYSIYSPLRYSIELFYDSAFNDPINTFNDHPVISEVRHSNQIKNNDLSSLDGDPIGEVQEYYGKLTFQDVGRLSKLKRVFDSGLFSDRFLQSDFIKCTVYQQGSYVDDSVEVSEVDVGIYSLTFNISKSDGVEYKDGLGVAKISIAGQCSSDYLELSIKEEKRIINTDLIEEVSVYNNQSLFIERYGKDDLYNSFGDKTHYSASFYNNDGSISNYKRVSSMTDMTSSGPVDFSTLFDDHILGDPE